MLTLPTRYREEFIERLMETGNVSRSASALGVNRLTVYRWRDEDPEFAHAWDAALDVARQGLRERVVETACAMGVGEWVPALDPITGEPELDDDFEPILRFETRHVDARVLMKLMDKTMRDEVRTIDQRTAVAGRVEHEHRVEEAPALVLVDPDGAETPLAPRTGEEDGLDRA